MDLLVAILGSFCGIIYIMYRYGQEELGDRWAPLPYCGCYYRCRRQRNSLVDILCISCSTCNLRSLEAVA